MNLLPTIDKPRRSFKFSNPLSGITYNNNFYLRQCQYEPDPEAMSLIRKKSHRNFTFSVHSKEDKPTLESMAQSQHKYKYLSKASDSKINYSLVQTNTSNMDGPELSKSNKSVYKFPDIEIKIIDEIQSYKDFVEKNLKVNFSHYFGMFFKKSLAGALTIDLIEIVQKYLQILTSKRGLDSGTDMKDYPSEYFCLKSKRAFVERIE